MGPRARIIRLGISELYPIKASKDVRTRAGLGTLTANLRPMCRLLHFAPVLIATSLTACGSTPSQKTQPLPISEARSEAKRLAPDASADAVRELARNNEAFALDLLRKTREDENFFYSPHSISIALAMTYAGAEGETKEQMKSVLHFAQPDAELNAAFNTLDQELESRGENAKGADGQPFRLRIANALWSQEGETFLPSYLDTLAESYGAGVNLLDFIHHTEKARQTINAWVSERTEARIPELLPQGLLNPNTRFVLTNAVYFNAAWAKPFVPQSTQDGPFTLANGSSVSVPLMHGLIEGRYAEGADYQTAEIPYDGHEVAMIAVLPKGQSLESFEASLDSERMESIVGSLSRAKIRLTLPRFEMRTRLLLAEVLKEMGMTAAFAPGEANFSGMDGKRTLFLREVVHEAFVKVNEAGTEAAAATAVIGERTSAEPEVPIVDFEATRPFLFFIRDNETGANLFLGRVVNPQG